MFMKKLKKLKTAIYISRNIDILIYMYSFILCFLILTGSYFIYSKILEKKCVGEKHIRNIE